MKRILTAVVIGLAASMVAAPAALACGFLVSANGAVRLGKTTTFVVWEDGIEHLPDPVLRGERQLGDLGNVVALS